MDFLPNLKIDSFDSVLDSLSKTFSEISATSFVDKLAQQADAVIAKAIELGVPQPVVDLLRQKAAKAVDGKTDLKSILTAAEKLSDNLSDNDMLQLLEGFNDV